MKLLLPRLLGAATFLLLAGSPAAGQEESHILAKKNGPGLPGSKWQEETTGEARNGIYTFTDEEGEKTQGKGGSTSECLSPSRYRRNLTKFEERHQLDLMGEKVDEPGEPDPLLGIPVILDQKDDGSFTAALEKGEPTEEQKKALSDLTEEWGCNDESVQFGEVPRKPGDKWEPDVTKLSTHPFGKDLRGTLAVEFTGIETLRGMRCAVLKSRWDISGTMDDEGGNASKFTLKGEETTYRSLKDLVNVETVIEGRLTLDGMAEGMPMTMESPIILTSRTSDLSPAPAPEKTEPRVLAEKGSRYAWPVGTKMSTESVAAMKHFAISVTMADGEEVEGSMSRLDTTVDEMEVLEPGKTRHVLRKLDRKGSMVMNGKEEATREGKSEMLDVPVIVETKDGETRTSLEAGKPSKSQEAYIGMRLRSEMAVDRDLTLYGDTPRQAGDKWEVNPGKLLTFAGGKQLQGNFTMEFLRTEEYQGQPCAVLKAVFDLKGIPAPRPNGHNSEWRLKGESVTYRSLADRIDLLSDLTGETSLREKRDGGETVLVNGVTTMRTTAKLKKP